jgi:hypothetical protein
LVKAINHSPEQGFPQAGCFASIAFYVLPERSQPASVFSEMCSARLSAASIGDRPDEDGTARSRQWRLSALVPTYGRPAWFGPDRHPDSADDFGSVASLQHIARTLASGGFDLALIDPASRADGPAVFDPWLGAMVMALAAPGLRVGLRREPVRRTGAPDPAALLGGQWAGLLSPSQPLLSVRVLVAANRWMAEDQLEYALRHYPLGSGRAGRREADIPTVVGTPKEVADDLEGLFARRAHESASEEQPMQVELPARAAQPDTSVVAVPMLELVPVHIPGSYEAFVRMVVPQLRRRGLIGEHGSPWRPTT